MIGEISVSVSILSVLFLVEDSCYGKIASEEIYEDNASKSYSERDVKYRMNDD